MAVLTPVGAASVNRAYYGSDTRAQGLLVGAALAAVCLGGARCAPPPADGCWASAVWSGAVGSW